MPELVVSMATSLGRAPHLFKVPDTLLALAAQLTGRTAELERLTLPLVIDDRLIRQDLRWSPTYRFHEGIREMALSYTAAVKITT